MTIAEATEIHEYKKLMDISHLSCTISAFNANHSKCPALRFYSDQYALDFYTLDMPWHVKNKTGITLFFTMISIISEFISLLTGVLCLSTNRATFYLWVELCLNNHGFYWIYYQSKDKQINQWEYSLAKCPAWSNQNWSVHQMRLLIGLAEPDPP